MKTMKQKMANIRITLSLGERSYESFKALKEAGRSPKKKSN